jgi:uncharacterized damage-inducible protein DinB
MKRLLILVLLLGMSSVPALTQGPITEGGAPPDPLSRAVKGMWDGVKRNIAESADKMPEANFAFKPTPEVRSFGGLLGHIANSNYSYCAGAKGEPNPNQGNDFEKKTAKADLVKAIADSNAYCDAVYGSMNDMKAMELIKAGQGEVPRIARLITNVSHDNEHYGNIVTYMRLKGLVPPSTERAQQKPKH